MKHFPGERGELERTPPRRVIGETIVCANLSADSQLNRATLTLEILQGSSTLITLLATFPRRARSTKLFRWALECSTIPVVAVVAVVGDGAVGLMGVLAAKEMRAERIIVMSRHKSRQELARDFGATDIVAERGAAGLERVKELTGGVGADSVLECVGTQESMTQAIDSTWPGGSNRLCRRALA